MNERRKVQKTVLVTGRRETDFPHEMTYEMMMAHINAHTSEVVAASVESAIEKNVNGKINKLTDSFNSYVEKDIEWKKEDVEWKGRAEPWLRAAENSSWVFRIFVTVLKTTGLLATAIAAYLYLKSIIK